MKIAKEVDVQNVTILSAALDTDCNGVTFVRIGNIKKIEITRE